VAASGWGTLDTKERLMLHATLPLLGIPPLLTQEKPGNPSTRDPAIVFFNSHPSARIALYGLVASQVFNLASSYALGAVQNPALTLGLKRTLLTGLSRIGPWGMWASAAFTAGLLMGRGIDHLPTLWDSSRISQGASMAAMNAWGPGSKALLGVADFLGLN
jgi:hypothetical protein